MAYDPRAVKLPKSVKRLAANEIDAHKRGAIIRSYVQILESESKGAKKSSKESRSKYQSRSTSVGRLPGS